MAVLIQWARDDGPIHLFNPWKNPIHETLRLIEMFMVEGTVGFNLAFDHFHLCKLYTIFSSYPDHEAYPEDIIEELAELELSGRDGQCLKPSSACDLFLHARKGPYQSTMDRSDIRIRRVPTPLAWQLAAELEKRVPLNDIYFARRKNKNVEKWKVFDIEDEDGKMNPDFKDICLKFAPSAGLKALAADALKVNTEEILMFGEVGVAKKYNPVEFGYAPFAKAVGSKENWKGAWPEVIHWHFDHWEYSERSRKYATDDVVYTRDLYYHFGSPTLGDDDSILACMVAAVRWKGFKIDYQGIKTLKTKAIVKSMKAPTAPAAVKKYVFPLLSDEERLIIGGSTKKIILETIADYLDDCPKCEGDGCEACEETGEVIHPAAVKAKEVLDARSAQKENELYDKLLRAKRFHASFKVIGTLSSRMAGADKLNPQGIKRTKEVRRCFPLCETATHISDYQDFFIGPSPKRKLDQDFVLCGGDFESFEVVIAEAVFDDPFLRKELQSGKKIHALFAEELYPEETYDSILASKGTEVDLYNRGKGGVFSQIYGGDANTLQTRLGIDVDTAETAAKNWAKRFPGIGRFQQKIYNSFCSMRQPGGIGSRVVWNEPDDYIESLTGFRRYFTLENKICKALFDLGEHPPDDWSKLKIKVNRRDREQTVTGATRSALFGAAFGIQSANMRAAANHVIQSTGAQITKRLQRNIWEIQPSGINDWQVQPMNVHDEIMCPILPKHIPQLNKIVHDTVESYRDQVPLIGMDWTNYIETWADK
jgi:hypothetical protein